MVPLYSCLYLAWQERVMNKVLDNDIIGAKIREFRQGAGLTQEKLAEALGITFQQVQKYERGITKVNLQKLQQLAGILQVPVAAFFDDSTGTVYKLSEQEKVVLRLFRNIRQQHRKSLLDILGGLAGK